MQRISWDWRTDRVDPLVMEQFWLCTHVLVGPKFDGWLWGGEAFSVKSVRSSIEYSMLDKVDHLLVQCQLADLVSANILRWVNAPNTAFVTVKDVLSLHDSWSDSAIYKDLLPAIFCVLFGVNLWKARNNRIFKGI
ncbi:hypothetical protein QVD17_11474 [Tagetes erecta]|uniref:Reverse transcriptase zinc-binding domain-containing protein n=1 Tax=Tagetes erecta TaxID=13708 RepID=A0AAD8KUI3_TARER|nr:hypothetical protein QVD17_11474 [Tagetes erecta]